MLTLRKHISSLSSFFVPARDLTLSPVADEDDELIEEINNQTSDNDDDWTLTAEPDVQELETEWNAIAKDVESDPEWNKFSDD